MAERIGLYGGSFDPIHFGHLISARSIAEQINLHRVVLILSPRPPHKVGEHLTDAGDRLAMARLAVQGDPLFEVSDIELARAGPSYTIDTVTAFRRQLGPEAELFWIIGADSLPELPTWRRVRDLVAAVQIVTARRPGSRLPDSAALEAAVGAAPAAALIQYCVDTPEIDISSTEVRERVGLGRSVRYLVPEVVASYIAQKGLYISR
ncbi:MAG TPA: nicotinate-nucleotide adenylyltransferase [Phycisphaerae bacterium]|nr:nicotinate-nucleotide adenylyltransferase [Phycisphaerae bacterium]